MEEGKAVCLQCERASKKNFDTNFQRNTTMRNNMGEKLCALLLFNLYLKYDTSV